jgi:hypothetical protein
VRFTRRHAIAAAVCASLALIVIDLNESSAFSYRISQPDFFVYYLAAQIGRSHGWAAIYDPSVFLPAVTGAVGRPLPYLNPPELAWLVIPLSWLPYPLAASLWTGILAGSFTITWYLAAPGRRVIRLVHFLGAAALLPVFASLLFGQVSLLIVAAVALCWCLLERRRPWFAGVALAAVALKPQVAFLVPVALLAAGYWRVFLGWMAASLPLALLALLAAGPAAVGLIEHSLRLVSAIPGPVQVSMARQLPLPVAALAIPAVLALALFIVRRYRRGNAGLPVAVGLVTSLLVTPYVNFYDLSALVLAAWLVLRLDPPRWQRVVTLTMYLPLYVTPVWPLIILVGEVAWLLSLAALAIVEHRQAGGAAEALRPAA